MMFRSAVLLLLMLVACTPLPSVLPLVKPAGEVERVEEMLLARLANDARAFSTLEGVAKVRVRSGGRSFGATQVLFAEKPDSLRAETLSPFGQPMLLMATDGEQMTVMIPSEGKFYRDRASAENLQRFTKLPLRLDDLVHILLYQVPLIVYDRRDLVTGEDSYQMVLWDDKRNRRQELRFDSRMNLLETAYYFDNRSQLEIRFSEISPETGRFPRRIAMRMPPLEAEASLDFSEVRTNVAIPEERFILEPVPGMTVSPISPLSAEGE